MFNNMYRYVSSMIKILSLALLIW